MRLLLLTTLSLSSLLFSTQGKAQVYSSSLHPETDFGIKAGGSFQEITASPFVPAYNTGFVGGLYAGKHSTKAGFRVELLVNNAQYKTERPAAYGTFQERGTDTSSKGSFKAMYISIPVLAEINLTKKLLFEIGPQYNYMLSFTDNNGVYTKIFKNDKILKPGEFCLALGLNGNLPHHLNLGVRYIKGITSVNKETYYRAYDAWSLNTAQVTLSYNLIN